MLIVDGYHPKPKPKNLATIDHLEDRFSPFRGAFQGECRHVLACDECNNKRGAASQEAAGKEMLTVMAKRGLRAKQERRALAKAQEA